GAAHGVLANDTDPDGDTLSADPLTGVSHGTLDLHTDGSFTYTPGAGFFGKDHFTYQADDGQGGTSDPTTATITVHSDEAPSAADNHYTFMPLVQGPQLSVDAPGVLANDTDPDGDHLTAHTAAPPKEGTVALNADGSFDYVPDAGVCNATDRFTYRASDGILTSTPAKVTIKIQTPRDPTAMSFKVSNHSVRFGQFVNLRVHLGRFSPGAVVRFFSRRPGGTPKPIGAVEPDPKTHVAKLHVRPARNTLYSALSDDNCFVSVRSGSQKVAVAAVGGGHMIGLGPHGVPTYVAYVRPTQPDGTVTFVWQRKGKGRWVPYFHQVVNLNDRGHVALGLTSGVVRHVRYRVTLRWTGKGGNLPGHGRWTYFQVG
ncbi:MAG TPA: Ig-like domain-containing protein, partial [Actinomycetota bacterium]